MPLNYLSAVYNGEISVEEAEISQRNLEKKIEDLKCDIDQKTKKKKKK